MPTCNCMNPRCWKVGRCLAQYPEIDRLRALLLNALPHVEGARDDTLATIIYQELSQRREPRREGNHR